MEFYVVMAFFAAMGALLILVGLSIVRRAFAAWFEARAAHTWPTVRGEIINTWVDHDPPGYKKPYGTVYPRVRYLSWLLIHPPLLLV